VKLLLDENLSPRLVAAIDSLYPGSSHVEDCGLLSATDDQVWLFAFENEFTIVTKDSDFSERSVLDGCPPKVIWLRIGNSKTSRAASALLDNSDEIHRFSDSVLDCCLVISPLSTGKKE
jgi:predicted nuclease of predicted toxin-antitoxin system